MIVFAIGIWILLNVLLFVFVIHEFGLMLSAVFKKKKPLLSTPLTTFPKVIVQLPVYNEKYVILRLLESVRKMNYPTDQLTIQVLDDSTDETTALIARFISELTANDHDFIHVRRKDRMGFKAGALAHGMKISAGEFYAIFDADFLPDPNFLMETLPFFSDEQVGVVQTRWGHLNEDYSIITRAQSVMLDAHFGIEQRGRSRANGFINFNGTAGIWRRTCIEAAGGWEADTLTEDLDLSFRAQTLHWKIAYRFHVISPAELPLTFSAFRNQQFRWSKGAAECFRKNVKRLWSARLPLKTKFIGSFHLLNSSVYLLVLGLMLFAPLVYYLQNTVLSDAHYLIKDVVPLLGVSINLLLVLIFFAGRMICAKNQWKATLHFIPALFFFFSMTVGISVHIVLGLFEGYRGKRSEFVRTPKFGKNMRRASHQKNYYGFRARFNLKIIELTLLGYGIFWSIIGWQELNPLMIIYSGILVTGFSLSLFFENQTLSWKTEKK